MAKFKVSEKDGKNIKSRVLTEEERAKERAMTEGDRLATEALRKMRAKKAEELARMSNARVSLAQLQQNSEQREEAQPSSDSETPANSDEQKRLEELWAANRTKKATKRKAQDDEEDEEDGVDIDDYEEDVDDSDVDPDFAPPGDNVRGSSDEEDEFDEEQEGDTRRFRRFVPLQLDPSLADGNDKTARLRHRRRLVRAERKKKEASRVRKTFKERRENAVAELKKLKDKQILKKRQRKRPERFYTHETMDKAVNDYKEQVDTRRLGLNIPKGTGCRAIAKKYNLSKSTVFDKIKHPNRRPFAGESNQFSL